MPGFNVSGLGQGPTNKLRPFYTYTWELTTVFGENGQNPPLIFAREITLPAFAVLKDEYESPSLVYKFAAQANWDDIRLTFYDIPSPDGGDKLADTLKEWRQRVWNDMEGVKLAESSGGSGGGYKKRTAIKVFNMDDTARYSWILHGSWPQSVKEGDLTYTDSDVKIVEVIVVYDWAELEEI